VRGLKRALEFAFVVAESGLIEPRHLPNPSLHKEERIGEPSPAVEADSEEKSALTAALKEIGVNRT